MLHCLASTTSYHCPLVVGCTPRSRAPRRFHFERFWPKLEGFQTVVTGAWASVPPDPDPFRRIYARLKATAKHLQSWSAKKLGHIMIQLMIARELIAHLDAAQDIRPLSPAETWLRRELKRAYVGLASLECSIQRHRTRFAWLRDGETNSAFHKIHAAHRQQKNFIAKLRVGHDVTRSEEGLARAAFEHFSGILGATDERPFTLNLGIMDTRSFNLSELERPFSEDELWNAVKQLPTGKSSGPDGFSSEFLHSCWPIIKDDFCEAFDKLFTGNG
ncbi:uncharacterized protein [Aegilops tauschii subsp. strangulata]|uniref:uncharacterized protein n=1 Tax=Aegilops tauschii subsp. strangulata TaxID=200361 RepID=UPI003CC87B99